MATFVPAPPTVAAEPRGHLRWDAANDAAVASPQCPVRAERVWRPAWPCPCRADPGVTRGGGDPTFRIDADGTVWRGIRTPEGAATLRLEPGPATARCGPTAWGDGAEWALESVPALLGADDDPTGFDADPPGAGRGPPPAGRTGGSPHRPGDGGARAGDHRAEGHRPGGAGRVPAAGAPLRRAGAGRRRRARLWLQPSAETVRMIPSWEWLRAARRPGAVAGRRHAPPRVAASLERTVGLPADEVDRRLRSLPGVGVWTSAEVRFRAHGDADAVSFGDYHIAKDVGWALTGERGRRRRARRAARALPPAPLPGAAPGRACRAAPAPTRTADGAATHLPGRTPGTP